MLDISLCGPKPVLLPLIAVGCGFKALEIIIIFFIYFFIYKIQTPVTRGSVLVVGLPALSRPVVSASLHKQCTKRNRGFVDEGRVETKETKERRRTEEVGGLEICGGAESVKKWTIIVWLGVVNIGSRLWPRASTTR